MAVLELLPDDNSYSYQDDSEEYYVARFDGAAGFYSKGISGPKLFPCRWTLNSEEYVSWIDFFRSRERYRDSFQIDLISIDGYPIPHTARFVFNSFSLVEHSGEMFAVRCDILAKPGAMANNTFIKLTEDGFPKITEDSSFYKILE